VLLAVSTSRIDDNFWYSVSSATSLIVMVHTATDLGTDNFTNVLILAFF
jgi:hypothetical protein